MSKSIKFTNGVYLDSTNVHTKVKAWIPEISALNETAPTVTYTSRSGIYYEIGELVYIQFYIRGKITALNGTNNFATISGFPIYIGGSLGTKVIPIGTLYAATESENSPIFLMQGNNVRIQVNNGAAAVKWKVTTANYFEIAGQGIVAK